jgi:hypothetical protein
MTSEVRQIAIVAVFLPLASFLRQRLVLAGGSSAIVVAAALWFGERAFELNFLPVHWRPAA